ncbi:MAG: hypothetical protein E7230_03445 [Clostridiales bacterium]|nr:hypothetical protein [Clostridiales bacterium]
MTIEIKEKGSKQYYEEIANINSQYMQLLRNPRLKLGNTFRLHTILAAVMPVVFILYIVFAIKGGSFRPASVIVLFVIALSAYASFTYLRKTKKMVNDFLTNGADETLTLDKKGVALKREGSEEVRLRWGNVAFVRVFEESTCFFAEDKSGVVIPVNNAYRDEVLQFLRKSNLHIPIIADR